MSNTTKICFTIIVVVFLTACVVSEISKRKHELEMEKIKSSTPVENVGGGVPVQDHSLIL